MMEIGVFDTQLELLFITICLLSLIKVSFLIVSHSPFSISTYKNDFTSGMLVNTSYWRRQVGAGGGYLLWREQQLVQRLQLSG